MFFSIIVPIYKVELYIQECIESVLAQNFKDFELILVDDGSPDNCPNICDNYAQGDVRIKVIHKCNGGLSSARNGGLAIAKGKYIIFLDGDDKLYDNILEVIYMKYNNFNYELIIGNQTRIIAGSCSKNDYPLDISTTNINVMIYEFITRYRKIPWAAYQNIYLRSFIKENELIFTEKLVGAEDCDWFFRYINKVKSFSITNDSLVYYRIGRIGSITNCQSYNAVIGQLSTFKRIFDEIDTYNDITSFQKNKMKLYFSNKFTDIIPLAFKLNDGNEILNCLKLIKNNYYIVRFSKGFKHTVAKLVWLVLGLKKGSYILNSINTLRRK